MVGFMALLAFVIGGTIVIVLMHKKNKKEKEEKLEKDSFAFKRQEVLKIVYEKSKKAGKIAGMPIRILKITEELNMMPKDLQLIYQSLQQDKLIHLENDSLYLTDFGKDYVEIFVNGGKDV
jgi:hypothetical protein